MIWKLTWRSRLAEAEPLRKEVFRAINELKNDLFTKFCVRSCCCRASCFKATFIDNTLQGYVLVHANVLNQYSYNDRNAQGFELSTLNQVAILLPPPTH